MNHPFDVNGRKRSYEVQALDQASPAYRGNMAAPLASYQWHEMDYTSSAMDSTRFAPTSAPIQYATPGLMSFSPVDYTQQHDFSYANAYSDNDHSATAQTSDLYRVGPFRLTDLANIDADTASVSQESMYSRSTRIHSLTDSERRDSHPTSILSGTDARRESDGYGRSFRVSSLDPDNTHGDTCRQDPSSLDMANLGRIEECAPGARMIASPHFIARTPQCDTKAKTGRDSPVCATHSGLTSPVPLMFHELTTTDGSSNTKTRRMPRPKSANATPGDNNAADKATKLRARQAHSLVERKYRDNLNLKISQLHQTLQNARYTSRLGTKSPQKDLRFEYFDEDTIVSPDVPNEKSSTGSTPTGPKVRKSDVLSEAMNYINAAEVEMRHMSEELLRLTKELETVHKQPRCADCRLLKDMDTLQVEGLARQAGLKR